MSTIAKATDWKIEKMADQVATLNYQRVFSWAEFDRIRQGVIPTAMEQKWFIYCENNTLNFHRSWTGHHIFQVVLKQEKDTYKVVRTIVNRNKDQYNQDDDDYDVLFVNSMIDGLIRGFWSFPQPNEKPTTPPDNKLLACLMGGAIGDSIGSRYEGQSTVATVDFDTPGYITDDTQLTLATCESIFWSKTVSPPAIAAKMLEWYNRRKLTGLGSSTLKALRDLQVGAHWALSGRSGEYAAGNGAAMRIAPLAFFVDATAQQQLIRDICIITHKNDEAYVGCLAIIHAIQAIVKGKWQPDQSLIDLIIPHLPDTSVRDNLEKLRQVPHIPIHEAASLVGSSGHVVQSIPLAIFAAQKVREIGIENVISAIIRCGSDTDTNASLAGQIMGAFIGSNAFPQKSLMYYNKIKESQYINLLGKELWKITPNPRRTG